MSRASAVSVKCSGCVEKQGNHPKLSSGEGTGAQVSDMFVWSLPDLGAYSSIDREDFEGDALLSVHEILGLWPAGSGRLPESCEMRESHLCSVNFKESLVFSGRRGGAPRQGDKLKALPGSGGRTHSLPRGGGGGGGVCVETLKRTSGRGGNWRQRPGVWLGSLSGDVITG